MISKIARSRLMVQRAMAMKQPGNPLPSMPAFSPASLTCIPRRFDGSYVHYHNYAEGPLAREDKRGDIYLDESEVLTRMLYVLKNYGIYDLANIDWKTKWADQGIDSLEQTALLTSFEHEFHTIFEDNLFEHFETFEQVKNHIMNDHACF